MKSYYCCVGAGLGAVGSQWGIAQEPAGLLTLMNAYPSASLQTVLFVAGYNDHTDIVMLVLHLSARLACKLSIVHAGGLEALGSKHHSLGLGVSRGKPAIAVSLSGCCHAPWPA